MHILLTLVLHLRRTAQVLQPDLQLFLSITNLPIVTVIQFPADLLEQMAQARFLLVDNPKKITYN
jgi:hypothetical protein